MSQTLAKERWHSDITLPGVCRDKPMCTPQIAEILEVRHVENYALWYMLITFFYTSMIIASKYIIFIVFKFQFQKYVIKFCLIVRYDYKICRSKFSLGGVHHHLDPIDLQGGLAALEDKYGVDREANEVFLFHGTSDAVSQIITSQGFDPRISRSEGHYGTIPFFITFFSFQHQKVSFFSN